MGEEPQTVRPSGPGRPGGALPRPPSLPPRLADPVPVLAVGTTLWLLAFVTLLVARVGFGFDRPVWLWTTLCGAVLGVIGYGIFRWQRAAARRDPRNSQRGLGL
ncbi:DUF2530 domain-containing protein [Gandjariella thermophila]|uniref:DUF2530 domain-containing protein n=1 Tax=Gandjariella thermophila TaxID=1931992 RepID=UPI001CEF9FFF|nr:DUF2530 domain-containing protein [Gandjariella thermophila]